MTPTGDAMSLQNLMVETWLSSTDIQLRPLVKANAMLSMLTRSKLQLLANTTESSWCDNPLHVACLQAVRSNAN